MLIIMNEVMQQIKLVDDISIGTSEEKDTGVNVYYHCVCRDEFIGWAYMVVVNGHLASSDSGNNAGNLRHTELETLLSALNSVPSDISHVKVYTSCRHIRNNLDTTPKQYKKQFSELNLLIAKMGVEFFWRKGNWGDECFAQCEQMAEEAAKLAAG